MAKAIFTTGQFTFNSVEYGVTSFDMSKVAEEVDVTDTDTSGSEKEWLAGRQSREFTIEMWKDVNTADPALATEYAGELDYEGYTYGGNMILLEITNRAQIDQAIVLTIRGRFSGTVTETPAT